MKLEKIFAIKDDTRFRKELQKWREQRIKRRIPFDHLSKGEQRWARIEACCWEINGEGLEGFFDNADGDRAYDMLRDFKAIGAKNAASILQRAIRLFPGGKMPKDTDQRQAVLERMLKNKKAAKSFRDLGDEFHGSDPDGLRELLWRYFREHPGDFQPPDVPAEKPIRVQLGKPKVNARLKDYLANPIWLPAEVVNTRSHRGREVPVIAPKTNVSEDVLRLGKKHLCLPKILLRWASEEGDAYLVADLDRDRSVITELFFWVDESWMDFFDLGGLPSRTITVVAVPSILGKKDVEFVIKKGTMYGVLNK